jgi:serine/threonine protein kinase
VHHENVIGCRDIFMDEYWCYIFTDFCEGGTVEDLLQRCGVLKEKEAIPIIKDVFEGLLYLEKNHIIHRDLKAANIFLNHKRRAVVADFGFSTQIKYFFLLVVGSLFVI